VNEGGESSRAAHHRFACSRSAGVRCRAFQAVLAEVEDMTARDFILGQPPRPALERAFEDGLWKARFKAAFCKVEGEGVQIVFDFEAQPPPRLHDLAVYIRRIAAELRPGESCGTISSVRRDNRVVVKFTFGPRRSGMEQFTRYRERRASAEHGSAG
jgi:hypothetical protein